MVTLNAHFDGKAIVPDEPVTFAANQRLRITVEPIEPARAEPESRTDWHALIGIAHNAGPRPYDPAEEDALWEGTTGNYLEKGPNKPSIQKPAK